MGLLVVTVYELKLEEGMKSRDEFYARITNVGDSNEDLERILVIRLSNPSFNISFDFGFTFLSMTKGRLHEIL